MFQVIEKDKDRLDIEIKGKVNADEMHDALEDLIGKSEQITNGKMLYRIQELQLPTASALKVELTRVPALFKLLHRFSRVALIADQGWLRIAGELESALIPGIEIKGFEPTETAEAEAWLSQ